LGALERRRREGARLLAIVLTHHHGDHTAGVEGLVKATGAPVWAHALTADRCPVPVARLLAEGEVLRLGGEPETAWEVLHTPGHARGHVCLVERARHAAVVGDMVSSLSTIIIDPPEGDMVEYLRQLERLKALPVGTLYPAHGPPVPDGVAKLEEYLLHRAWREGRVVEALATLGRPATTEELVPLAYDDVAAFVHPIAERNVAATLDKLAAEGRAREHQGRWTAVSAA
jgi:endoribonuclease LACTB2